MYGLLQMHSFVQISKSGVDFHFPAIFSPKKITLRAVGYVDTGSENKIRLGPQCARYAYVRGASHAEVCSHL